MARKKAHPEHVNHERWLVSYADFITLLFAFFVVMFASSQTDKSKAQVVSESVKKAIEKGGVPAVVRQILGGTVDDKGVGNAMMKGPGGSQPKNEPPPPTPAELAPSLKYLTEQLGREIKDGKLDLHLDQRGLVISLRQAAFFPSGTDAVDPSMLNSVKKISEALSGLPNQVLLEGHTDSRPIHTARFRSNWELSAARAIATLELLSSKGGIERQRLSIGGYAETVPIDTNDTEEGRAHNRRVDVVILNKHVIVKQPEHPGTAGATSKVEAAPGEKSAAPAGGEKPTPMPAPAPTATKK